MTTKNLPLLTDRTRRILDQTRNQSMYTHYARLVRDENGKVIGAIDETPMRPCSILYSIIDGTIHDAGYDGISNRSPHDTRIMRVKTDKKGALPEIIHGIPEVEEIVDSVQPPKADYATKRVLEQILVWRSEIE